MPSKTTVKLIPPPDPNPVKPKYAPPPDACDGHCHVFGPAKRFPYAKNRTYEPPDSPKEKLAALHKHLGFSRAVLVQASCHGTDNSAMLDAIKSSKDAWRGVAMVAKSTPQHELQNLNAGGVRGLRYNFVRHLGGMPELDVVEGMAARIAPLGWHLQLHLDADGIVEQRAFLRKLKIPFIIDHMGRVPAQRGLGQPAFRQLLELLKDSQFAWVKISGPERISATGKPFHDAIPFAQALIKAAPDRVMWGTDFPHPNVKWMPNDGELVNLFAMMCEDDATRKQILVDNPTRLYWAETLKK
ncbi:MAG: amidohydrolase family protein [Betaproteobacteria bacterium]|nr:amidohydrolase family protein [Betaproteobacteria bacterium]